jgi:hypothetical protein
LISCRELAVIPIIVIPPVFPGDRDPAYAAFRIGN